MSRDEQSLPEELDLVHKLHFDKLEVQPGLHQKEHIVDVVSPPCDGLEQEDLPFKGGELVSIAVMLRRFERKNWVRREEGLWLPGEKAQRLLDLGDSKSRRYVQ
jgi:hypothetical protein